MRYDYGSGAMRHMIVIQRPTTATDDFGDSSKTYTEVLTVPAAITAADGNEGLEAGQVAGSITTKFVCRWLSEIKDVGPNWRVLMSNNDSPETFRTFDVTAAINTGGLNRFFEIVAVERL